MRICPQCKTENAPDSSTRCHACGAPLESAAETTPAAAAEDDLEFQVYENDSDDREFVGGASGFDHDEPAARRKKPPVVPVDDDDLRAGEAVGSSAADPEYAPVSGTSAFIPEPVEDEPAPSTDKIETPQSEEQLTDSGKIRHLSEAEVKSIASSLYRNDSYVSDKDKQELMQKMADKDQLFVGSTPIEPPKRKEREKVSPDEILAEIDDSIPSPKMAGRGRGIAYYYKNIIQIKGTQHISPGDELMVGNRQYELRPKRIGRGPMLIGSSIAFAAILVFVASLLISDQGGQGRVAGIVLDEYNLPLGGQARVRFPDLGQTLPVNAEGMFYSDNLPTGSHRIEVLEGGKVVASDFTTIAGGEISLVLLRPTESETVVETGAPDPAVDQPSTDVSSPQSPSSQSTAQSSTAKPQPTAKSSAGSSARLTLAANVDGAKVALNGSVLGAGNLTYDHLTPGVYTYKVTKEGYAPITGQLTLTSGQTEKLAVNLQPLSGEKKQQQYSAEDFYFSGLSAVQERDFRAAIADLQQAVQLDPGYGDAHFALGDAFTGIKDWPQAHDAYLRAAEIYRFGKDYNRAITAYNGAIQADGNSVPALLGRADLFLLRGDSRAATVDFEQVIRLDKRQPLAYIGLGRTRLAQGMSDQAIKHFKDARSIDSQNPVIYQYLMLAYMAESDFDEVRKSYDKFTQVATEQQISDLNADQRYAAALRVVNGRQ